MKKWVLLLVLFLFVQGCKIKPAEPVMLEQPKGIIIEDIVVDRLGFNCTVSFNIKNLNSSIADCQVRIGSGNRVLLRDVGILQPNSETNKQFNITINNETQIIVEPICRWADESTTQKCNTGDYADRKICELTLNNPDLQQCLVNNITYYEFFCIALLTKDIEVCDNIMLNSKLNWCKAYITRDTIFCDNIQDVKGKDWCYTDIGMNFKDLSICDKISDEKSKTSCMAVTKLDSQLCLKGAEEFKVSCILNIAESTGDKKICEILGEQKQECLERVS